MAGAVVTTAAAAMVLSGCGLAPWAGPDESAPAASQTAVPPPVPNDLSGGSTERELQAGAVAINVDYWSDLAMDDWTPEALKPVSLSLDTTITPDDGQKVYLQRATMVASPVGPDGDLPVLSPQIDSATVNPGYLVLSPYSYSQTFNVGAVPADATHVVLQFTYDFLVQTTPTSNEYAKQTATDSVTVAIAATPETE